LSVVVFYHTRSHPLPCPLSLPNTSRAGFIDFRFAAGAAAAVELNGSAQLGGRRVVVGTARRTASVKRDRRSMEARARRKEARQEARGEDAAPVG
jgi:hypothetical protein